MGFLSYLCFTFNKHQKNCKFALKTSAFFNAESTLDSTIENTCKTQQPFNGLQITNKFRNLINENQLIICVKEGPPESL